LGEEVFEFRVETVAPCDEFKAGLLLSLDEVDAVSFVEKRFSKKTDSE
jgi:hypothetical protein